MRRATKRGPGPSHLLITPDHAGNVVGIDPHKQTLTATVVDPRGGILAAEHFKVCGYGHRALEALGMSCREPVVRGCVDANVLRSSWTSESKRAESNGLYLSPSAVRGRLARNARRAVMRSRIVGTLPLRLRAAPGSSGTLARQPRNTSGPIPKSLATCAIGRPDSNASRTPRSINSCGYFDGLPMTRNSLPEDRILEIRSPSNPGQLRVSGSLRRRLGPSGRR